MRLATALFLCSLLTWSSQASAAKVKAAPQAKAPAKKKTINFTPRGEDGAPDKSLLESKNGANFVMGKPPSFGPARSPKVTAVDLESTACLVHGIGSQYLKFAFADGNLGSAYRRVGPYGEYSRDMDKIGGGGLAVYTRAVGTRHLTWQAKGYGVGSGGNTAQLVLSPVLLADEHHVWRGSGLDGGGLVPGAIKADTANKELDLWDLWSKQTEDGRNRAFNGVVTPKDNPVQNEQLHWEKFPLAGNLKAVICTTAECFAEALKTDHAVKTDDSHGTVRVGGADIPLLLLGEKDSLLTKLKDAGIANAKYQVR